MEDFETLDAGLGSANLALSPTDASNLRTAGKWGRFIAITGLVLIGIGIVSMLIFGSSLVAMGSSPELAMLTGGAGSFFIVLLAFYGIIFAVSIYLYWQLLQFSTNAIKAADTGSQVAMTASFESLKTMFKITGIMVAIMLGLYALTFVLTILGGLASFL